MGGDQVTYKYDDGSLPAITYIDGELFSGDLWTAQWWTYDDVPSGMYCVIAARRLTDPHHMTGPASVWVNGGGCAAGLATAKTGDSVQEILGVSPAIAANEP